MKKRIICFIVAVIVAFCCFGCKGNGASQGGASHIPGCLLHLPFNAVSGSMTTDEISGAEYKVEHVFNNAAYKAPSDAVTVKGVAGNALLFDGYSDYIDCGDNILNKSQSFGVNAWVALRSFDYPDGNMTPIAEYYSIQNSRGFVFGYTNYGKWGLRIWTPTEGWQEVYADDRLDLFKWYNLGFSFDGKTVKLYLNGTVCFEKSISSEANYFGDGSDFKFLVGRNTFDQTGNIYSFNGFSGAMDEFMVFSPVPDDELIKSIYESTLVDGTHPSCGYEAISYPADYLSDDVNRMSYHAAPYMNWMSDMCGGFYYNGKYHIFFQKNDTGPYFRSFSWGHLVSDDLVVWKEVAPAVWPTEGYYDNIFTFSGSAFLDDKMEPYIVYTGISTNGALCNLLMAKPVDLSDPELEKWEKLDAKLNLPDGYNAGEFRDPYVYTEDGTAYLVAVTQTSAGNPCIVGWTASLSDVTKWTFRGTVFETDKKGNGIEGKMWELPQLYRLENGKGDVKYMFTMTPVPDGSIKNNCMYWLGSLDKDSLRFTPEQQEPLLLDLGNDYMCAGSGFVDPVSGKNISFALAKCAEHTSAAQRALSGWAGTVTLLREYSLNDDGTLGIKPVENYNKLHNSELISIRGSEAKDVDLEKAYGRALHISLTMEDYESSEKAGIRFLSDGSKYVEFFYEPSTKRLCLNTIFAGDTDVKGYNYTFFDAGDSLSMELFIDKSSVEIYVEGKCVISSRLYLRDDCDGVSLTGDDWTVARLDIYDMNNIFDILAKN